MKKSSWILLLMLALALGLSACGGDGGARFEANPTLADVQPAGGFSGAGGGGAVFLVGGGTILAGGSPFRAVAIEGLPADAQINAVAYGDPTSVVAVGDNGLIVFTNQCWSDVPGYQVSTGGDLTSDMDLNAVGIEPPIVVAVGDNGVIVTAPLDQLGETDPWTARDSGTTAQLNGVTWDATSNRWVAVGDGGTVLTSTDLISWAEPTEYGIQALTEETTNWNAVTYDAWNTDTVMVGDGGQIGVFDPTASVGGNWYIRDSGVTANLNAAVFFDSVLAVGDNGTIISALDPMINADPGQDQDTFLGWTSFEDAFAEELGEVTTNFVAAACPSSGRVYVAGDGLVVVADWEYILGTPDRIYEEAKLGPLNAVHGTSTSDVYYVGDYGAILHFGSSGLRLVPSPTVQDLYDVFAARVDGGTMALAVGWAGYCVKIDREGDNFTTSVDRAAFVNLNGVFGANAEAIFAVGDTGLILEWNPGTEEFDALDGPTGEDLNDIWVGETGDEEFPFMAIAVGEFGTVVANTGDQGAFEIAERSGDPIGTVGCNAVFASGEDEDRLAFIACDDGKFFLLRPDFDVQGEFLFSFTVEEALRTGEFHELLGVWSPDPSSAIVVGGQVGGDPIALRWTPEGATELTAVLDQVGQDVRLNDVFGADIVGETDDMDIVLVRQ